MLKLIIYIYFFIFFSTSSAFAYIDPVTTSLVLKAIVSGIITCVVFIKRTREKILSIFGISKKKDDNPNDKKNLKQ